MPVRVKPAPEPVAAEAVKTSKYTATVRDSSFGVLQTPNKTPERRNQQKYGDTQPVHSLCECASPKADASAIPSLPRA